MILVVFLISSNGGNTTGTVTAGNPAVGVTTLPNANNNVDSAPGAVSSVSVPLDNSNTIEPIRMPITDFMKLYNSADRPLIVDVRAKAAYDEGHIAGAINIPDPETDANIDKYPKDKLVIAYCQ